MLRKLKACKAANQGGDPTPQQESDVLTTPASLPGEESALIWVSLTVKNALIHWRALGPDQRHYGP